MCRIPRRIKEVEKMKHWKKIVFAILAIVFAYVYSYTSESGFCIETFCVLLVLIFYIAWFFRFLDKLFSR